MSATTKRQEKDANAAFWACRKGERRHVRVGQRRQDGTQITLHGSAAELHGPNGQCTCCHGRSGQPAGKSERLDDAGPVPTLDSARRQTVADRVAALIHPNIAHVRQYRGADTLDHTRVRAAMRRFRPGQPLAWGGAR